MTIVGSRDGGGDAAAAADPFAAAPKSPKSEPRMTVNLTLLDYLRSQGINFPPGSSANYDPSINEVIVRNTTENLDLVETFIIGFSEDHAKTLSFEVHLIEAPSAMLRQIERDTAALADHSAAWASLQKALADHTATAVSTQWLQTRSGQRATLVAGDERTYLTGSGGSSGRATTTHDSGDKPETKSVQTVHNYLGNNDHWQFSPTFEMENVGTKMELDPVIGPDGFTIDLNCAITHHYAPPLLQHTPPTAIEKVSQAWTPTTSFNKATVQTQTTLMEGKPRLLSAWKPTGTAAYDGKDMRQAIFIIPHIQRLEQPEAK
jgi:hypothetical protein